MIHLAPVGLAAAPVANSVSMLAMYKEKLCACVCVTSTNQPNATVTYRTETPVLNGTTVFVPVIATVSITIPGRTINGCDTKVQTITERFQVAFVDQAALPTAVTITSNGMTQSLAKVVCGKSNCLAINDAITVAITPPAAA